MSKTCLRPVAAAAVVVVGVVDVYESSRMQLELATPQVPAPERSSLHWRVQGEWRVRQSGLEVQPEAEVPPEGDEPPVQDRPVPVGQQVPRGHLHLRPLQWVALRREAQTDFDVKEFKSVLYICRLCYF